MAGAIARASAVPDGAPDPARIARVGVLGAGTMGRGIAMAFAQTGREVVLVDPSEDARAEAMTHLSALAERKRSKGQLDEAGRAALMARIRPVAGLEAFSDADLVVEVVPEVMALKQKVMAGIEARTQGNSRLNLTVAINYGGRDELLRASKRLAARIARGEITEPSEADLAACLDTAGHPDPDLVIRTSGETRTSNFLPYQAAYSEYEFTPTLWPDFTPAHLAEILDRFGLRDRRFGGA